MLDDCFRWLARIAERYSAPRGLTAMSVYRVIVGVALLHQMLGSYANRALIWGPNGIFPYADWIHSLSAHDVSLYRLSSSSAWFELVFHAGVLVTFAWTMGFAPRWMTLLVWLAVWSLNSRNQGVLTGGHNLTQILLLFCVFCRVDARITLREAPLAQRSHARLDGLLHNAGCLAITLQVCIVYFTSAIWKIHGDRWFFGSAIYYALRNPEFLWPGVSERLYQNALVVSGLTYATWFFQLVFPFSLLIGGWTRRAVLVVALLFHVSIALVMGLPDFGVMMIAADLSLVSDDEYRALAAILRALAARVERNVARSASFRYALRRAQKT